MAGTNNGDRGIPIDRSFDPAREGIRSFTVRQTSLASNQYGTGTRHRHPAQFDAWAEQRL
ncbi:MAG: hypothetical protein ACP5PM_04655 [Acidimicrobiales bacterium]